MSAILKLVQGTPEWHAHRAKCRNASETAIVMGASPYMTPYQLWEVRTGRRTIEVTRPMLRGTELEPAARAAYETKTGLILEPLVMQEGEYSASLDGITIEGDLILEVKCPFKGRDSELWKAVDGGHLPDHYRWQIETQLMVSKARVAHLWVFDGKEGILLEVTPNPELWTSIHEAWERFMTSVTTDTPPPLNEKDVLVREDPEWQNAASAYLAARATAELHTTALDKAKAALIALASHNSEAGAGVKVTRFWKAGNVDYKKVPALKGVDLEIYRGAVREEVRVTVD